jgi:7,8-dihydropterin-6-yl-methyl-4-(beta-D-ribofuranosyl)aminobenzene 5'-phosphate synthase
MAELMAVTVLVENTAWGREVLGEHGLAFWIEKGPGPEGGSSQSPDSLENGDATRVLLDTGQTPHVLFHNARILGVDPSSADAVALSHGHYDHAGGMEEVLRGGREPALFLHPGVTVRRYSRQKNGQVQEIGIPPALDSEFLSSHSSTLTWGDGPTAVTDWMRLTGTIPRITEFEDTGGDFYLDRDCRIPDPIEDDQAAFFPTPQGSVILLGCGHAGIVNTMLRVRELTDGAPIHAVVGGMHLASASQDRLHQTVKALRAMDVKLIAPAHCTGPRAQARLASEFPDRWKPCHVGLRLEFPA